jgi:vesicle-associated membrane protein-associated protein A
MEQLADGHEEKLDKHRFLVQSATVNYDDFTRISALPVAKKSDELSKLWEYNKDEKRSTKLKVCHIPSNTSYPVLTCNFAFVFCHAKVIFDVKARQQSSSTSSTRSKLAREPSAASSSNTATSTIASQSSPEAIFSELQGLRKKYDAVVEYTVHLTAERDAIVEQLDKANKELGRARKGDSDSGDRGGGNGSETKLKGDSDVEKVVTSGFSAVVVLIVAIVAFVVGKFISSRS